MASVPPVPSVPTPTIPSETELRRKIMELQTKMGIPTEDMIDPLGPGAGQDELWPSQTANEWIDFRLT